MSFVFISHAGVDKPRIKPITDKLIDAGFVLWIDRPEEMGYTAEEIHASMHRMVSGRNWPKQIGHGLDDAFCVLLFASKRILEPGHPWWRKEFETAQVLGKLIIVRIDDIDLQKAKLPRGLAQTQWQDLLLAEDHEGPLDGPAATCFDLLCEDLHTMAEEARARAESRRQTRRQRWGPPLSEQPRPTLLQGQVEALTRMMDREEPVGRILGERNPVVVVSGPSEERPYALAERLRSVDLPLAGRRAAGFAEYETLADLRAAVVCGEADVEGFEWQIDAFTWPSEGLLEADEAFRQILLAIGERCFADLRAHEDVEVAFASEIKTALDRHRPRLLVTTLQDEHGSRAWTEPLVRRLAAATRKLPTDRLRILLIVQPAPAYWLAASTGVWWARMCKSAGLATPIPLEPVRRPQLDEWCTLVDRILDTALAIRSVLDDVYATVTKLPFVKVEREVRAALSARSLRLGDANSGTPQSGQGKHAV